MKSILVIMLTILLGACSREPRPPKAVKNAIELGIAKIDLLDTEFQNLGLEVVMMKCLPGVRSCWEEAKAELDKADPPNVKFTALRSELSEAIAVCKQLETKFAEDPFAGVLETGEFTIKAWRLAKTFGLKLKPPRKARDNELWFKPEAYQMDAQVGSGAPHAEITGLFGLELGKPLEARLVRKVDGWREMAEVGAYCVTPPQPHDFFDTYTVELLGGPIHKINASRNGRGQALVNIYDDAKKDLTARFGSPTSTGIIDARGDSGVAWDQRLRSGGKVRMTLALRKDSTLPSSGTIIPGMVLLEIQQL